MSPEIGGLTVGPTFIQGHLEHGRLQGGGLPSQLGNHGCSVVLKCISSWLLVHSSLIRHGICWDVSDKAGPKAVGTPHMEALTWWCCELSAGSCIPTCSGPGLEDWLGLWPNHRLRPLSIGCSANVNHKLSFHLLESDVFQNYEGERGWCLKQELSATFCVVWIYL